MANRLKTQFKHMCSWVSDPITANSRHLFNGIAPASRFEYYNSITIYLFASSEQMGLTGILFVYRMLCAIYNAFICICLLFANFQSPDGYIRQHFSYSLSKSGNQVEYFQYLFEGRSISFIHNTVHTLRKKREKCGNICKCIKDPPHEILTKLSMS